MKKILLSMLVVLMATGCSFTLNGKTEEEKKNDVVEEKETYESLSIDDATVTDLYKKINHVSNDYSFNFIGAFYQTDNMSVDKMDNKLKLFLALNNATTTTDELEQTLFVSESSLKTAMTDLFGNINYENESLSATGGCGFGYAQYDANNKNYSIGVACGGTGFPYYKTKLIQARKYSNKIEIYEKHIAVKPTWVKENNLDVEKDLIYKYFKLSNDNCNGYECLIGTNLISENVTDLNTNLDQYMNQADTYKYTFQLENGHYYFYSVEKVK